MKPLCRKIDRCVFNEIYTTYFAETEFPFHYAIGKVNENNFDVAFMTFDIEEITLKENLDNLEDAKQWAQDDFEKRILNSIEKN